MGSVESKCKSVDISSDKQADQQENGHVKANGDAPTNQNGDAAPANGSAEPPAEAAESGETIESAPPVNGDPKPEDPPGKQAKKNKRFSFKNLKFGNNPFRKTKKEPAPGEETPADENATESPQEPENKDGGAAAEASPEAASENGECETTTPSSDNAEEVQPEPTAPTSTEDSPKPVESEASTEASTEPQKQEE